MFRLQGKSAVITGGSSGIGLAVAQRFATEGAFVFVTGRRRSELEMAAALIGQRVATVQADVRNSRDIDRLYAAVREKDGKNDILVANAGVIDPQALRETTEDNFDNTFNTNVRGLLFTVQKALPLMRDGGSIILLSSAAAFKGTATNKTTGICRSCKRDSEDEYAGRIACSRRRKESPARASRKWRRYLDRRNRTAARLRLDRKLRRRSQ